MSKRPLPKHEPIKKGTCYKCGEEFEIHLLKFTRWLGKPAQLCPVCLSEKNEEKKPE